MPEFIPGLDLSEALFKDAVQPLLTNEQPNLAYSAARLDWGSDVLGYDTPMSMDHGWGPKLTLYLAPADYDERHEALDKLFAHQLPFEVRGFPTHFAEPYADGGVMVKKETHPIHHKSTILSGIPRPGYRSPQFHNRLADPPPAETANPAVRAHLS